MTDSKTVSVTDTETVKSPTLFVQIGDELDAQINETTTRTGISKSALVRLALPIGIRRFEEMHGFNGEAGV